MLRKDLYLQIYKRFANIHNFCVDKEACEDIIQGDRLFFGICAKYHPKYKEEWYKLTTPLFIQDLDYIIKKLGWLDKKDWNVDEVICAIKRGDFVGYIIRTTRLNFTVDEFFELYQEYSNTTINL